MAWYDDNSYRNNPSRFILYHFLRIFASLDAAMMTSSSSHNFRLEIEAEPPCLACDYLRKYQQQLAYAVKCAGS